MIAVALVVAGCASGSRGKATPSPTPTAAASSTPVPAASPCPVSSARSDGVIDVGGGRTVIVSERPLALIDGGVTRELRTHGSADDTALACAADGRFALGWIETRGEEVQRVRLALGDRVVTLARDTSFDALNPSLSGIALAFEPDGELLVAFAQGAKVRAVTVSPAGKVGRTVTVGRAIQFTDLAAEVAPNGRAVVAWATEDTGLQFDEPIHLLVATREAGRLFAPARTVHVGSSVDPDEGAPLEIALAVAPNGGAALMWSDVTGGYKRGGFRHPVLVSALDGAPRRLTGHGEIGDVAIRDDGTVLALFVSRKRLRAAVGGAAPADLGPASEARAFFDADGRPTVALPDGTTLHP